MILIALAAVIVVLCAVSLVFFRLGRALDVKKRVAASIHGLMLALLTLYGLMIDETGLTGSSNWLQLPALALLAIAIASMAFSCWVLRERWPYLLLHLVAIVLFQPILFWVGIAVVGWT